MRGIVCLIFTCLLKQLSKVELWYTKSMLALSLSLNYDITWVILPNDFLFLLWQIIVANWVVNLVTILIDSSASIFCCLQVVVDAAVPF